jgi:plastocyanin
MGWGRRVLAGAIACAGTIGFAASAAGATRVAAWSVPIEPAAATTVNVAIADTGFAPPSLSVPVGTVVVWTNQGTVPHTVTSVDGSFASDDLSPGATFPYQFTQQGTFQYRDVHSGDVGTVTVVSGALQGATSPGATTPSTVGAAPGQPAANPAGGPAMAFTGAGDWILGLAGAVLIALGVVLLRRNPTFEVPFRVDRDTALAIERGRRRRTDLLPERRRFRRR